MIALRFYGNYGGNLGNVLEELACYTVIIMTGESGGVPGILPLLKLQIIHN